jgi:hypothetical protein
MALALLLATAVLAKGDSEAVRSASATATIRIQRAVRLNDAAELDRSNAHIRLLRLLMNGKIEHVTVAEFE